MIHGKPVPPHVMTPNFDEFGSPDADEQNEPGFFITAEN
jgi:hypothetical protein